MGLDQFFYDFSHSVANSSQVGKWARCSAFDHYSTHLSCYLCIWVYT